MPGATIDAAGEKLLGQFADFGALIKYGLVASSGAGIWSLAL